MAKRKRTVSSDSEEEGFKTSKFVDVEASEEEEEEEESLSDFINEIAEEAESEESAASSVAEARTTHRPLELHPAEDFEEYSKKLEERYATEEEQLEVEEIPQQMLLPTERSPKLWLIRCTPKKEKHVVLGITRKCLAAEKAGNSLQIFSVLCNEGVKGYLYIEAYQKQQVLQAIEGVQGAFKTHIAQVPIKEMTDVLFISEVDPVMFREGNLLRLTKGKYAGDVVQIDGLSQNREMVVVKIVPRSGAGEVQELFSPDDYHPSEVYKLSRDSYVYKRETYRNGYLIKDVPTAHLSPAPPATPEETRWFTAGETSRANTGSVAKGEFVEVVTGGLKGVTGTVVGTAPEGAQLKIGERTVTIPLANLQKRYAVGEEVQVISGRKRGKSGFIIEIHQNTLKIGINDFTEEIEVKVEEVKLGSIPTGQSAAAPSTPALLRTRKDPLVNKMGAILAGEHKGKHGVVKDADEGLLRVQLITSLKHVQVPREDFAVQRSDSVFKEAGREREMYRGEAAPRTPPLYHSAPAAPSTPTTPVHSMNGRRVLDEFDEFE